MIFDIKPSNKEYVKQSREKWMSVAKPLHSLGKLEDAVNKISGIYGIDFVLDKRALAIMCSDNGVVAEGVTQCGQDITALVSKNFLSGETTACIMAKQADCHVFPFDIGVAQNVEGLNSQYKIRPGTDNMTKGRAMSYDEALNAVNAGIDIVKNLKAKGYKIICTGEMGIGNTTTSTAVACVLLNLKAENVTGRGAGLSSEGLEKKINAVNKTISINAPFKDVIDTISKVGGLDIAALTGVFLGGGIHGVPVVIDGLISAVSALCAYKINENVIDYILPSHNSKEKCCGEILKYLNLSPFIECGMFVGEGSGAVAVLPLIDMAAAVFNQMSTFSQIKMESYKEQL